MATPHETLVAARRALAKMSPAESQRIESLMEPFDDVLGQAFKALLIARSRGTEQCIEGLRRVADEMRANAALLDEMARLARVAVTAGWVREAEKKT